MGVLNFGRQKTDTVCQADSADNFLMFNIFSMCAHFHTKIFAPLYKMKLYNILLLLRHSIKKINQKNIDFTDKDSRRKSLPSEGNAYLINMCFCVLVIALVKNKYLTYVYKYNKYTF